MQYPPPPAHYKNASQLEPPPIPTQQNIEVYGYRVHLSFEKQMKENEAAWKTLQPVGTPAENAQALQKLNVSLLFNFIELIDVLLQDPTSANAKVDHIRQIMSSMHHLINAFRPMQAKNTAINMLQAQIQRRRDLLSKVNDSITKADAILAKAVDKLHNSTKSPAQLVAAATTNGPLNDSLNGVDASMDVDVTLDEVAPKRQRQPSAVAIARAGMLKVHSKMLSLVQNSTQPSSDAMDTS